MSQVVIPLEFERYLQDRIINGQAPDMNEMIFAYIPGLDPEQTIDRNQGLPDPSYWVYQQDVMQQAKLNDDAIIYSLVIPGEVKKFTFNAIYLHDKQTANSCGLVVHKMTETKEPEMSSVRSCVQQYSGAASIAKIHVTPESWQIDYHARLYGIDDDLRLACWDLFGDASFLGNGFQVKASDGGYQCSPGVGYVGGLRCVNDALTTLSNVQAGDGIYLDVRWQGDVLSRWATQWKLVVSATSLTDYVDHGTQHYVTQIAAVKANGSVTDLRHLGIDESKLPNATTTRKGVVALATDGNVKTGKGTGVISPRQLKQALDQFGGFGQPVDLGMITDNTALDSAPTGLIHFASDLITGKSTECQGVKIQHPDGDYSIIAGSGSQQEPALFFFHSVQNKWSTTLTHRTLYVENLLKGNQNWNVEGDAGELTTSPQNFAAGQEFSHGWFCGSDVTGIYLDSQTGAVYATAGTIFREYPLSTTAGLYASVTDANGLQTYADALETNGIRLAVEQATGQVRLTIDLSVYTSGIKIAALSYGRGLIPVISDDDSERAARGGYILIKDFRSRTKIWPDGTCDISMRATAGKAAAAYRNPLPITIKTFSTELGDSATANHWGGDAEVIIVIDSKNMPKSNNDIWLRTNHPTINVDTLIHIKARVA
ncbi:Tail fiber protein [Vibrio ruber DSM 16370]|uniref:Tail fiber protein n=1 Tax=Vibrio ruber (strain DSM 16370 / JCM 11486 / BCRC 17186 / CECT 7878 / LMG 23124 / VR1) TaxID=1123498 RepID=A0A1R4LQJ3_VIBR1|nr:phage tail protein [Vibrio ruber]SJN58738.1 Tail fiber protein [Vibrio ruber DSM 16370]